jgi:hypothetical protein
MSPLEALVGKYTPLKEFLLEQGKDRVPMTFAEIEKILDASLPASKRYPAWWSNNEFNNTMTSEWLAAGYQTESVDVDSEKLVFKKVGADKSGKKAKAADRPSIFGFMKGRMTLAEGYDPAAPLDIEWGKPYIGLEDIRK